MTTANTPKKRRTYYIHDVASKAGVSISTVSKALNGTGSLNPKTRKKVIRIAKELGYTPNPAARMLRAQRSENIGLFMYPSSVHLFQSPFHGNVALGLEGVLSKRNYNLLLAGTEFIGDEHKLPKFVIERSVDGVVILGKVPAVLFDELREYGLPFVIVDSEPEDASIDCVVSDNFDGATVATQLLIDHGHKQIGMLTVQNEDSSTLARFNAFRSSLLERGHFNPDLVFRTMHTEAGGMEAAQMMLQAHPLPTAIFCVNDSMAIGAMKVFREAGLRVPGDVSIIGFDDLFITQFLHPALTTIAVDKEQMGEVAATILLDRLADGDAAPCKRIIRTKLVERESVRRISN